MEKIYKVQLRNGTSRIDFYLNILFQPSKQSSIDSTSNSITSRFFSKEQINKNSKFSGSLKKISVSTWRSICSDFNRRLGPEGQDITISPRVPSPVSRRGMNVSRCRFQNSPWVSLKRRSLSKH